MAGCNVHVVLKLVSLAERKISSASHAHKTGSWYLLGFLFKISNKYPPVFVYMEIPLRADKSPEHLIMITFQLPVNTSLTLSLCCDQLQKIHFKAVTVPFK